MTALDCDPLTAPSVPSDELEGGRRVSANLSGVSETMLWSLYNRASETKRADAVLCDPDSVRIHNSIDYDFEGHFGEPSGSLAARAAAIDDVLRRWLERHPDGCIVSLGEGLETQAGRVDNGRMTWCSVDLPSAISLRERFLAPTDRFHHVAASVFDLAWMDAVDGSAGLCIVAQGLLMYLEPDRVGRLFAQIGRRFPNAEMVFDTVPRWFSALTLVGLDQTPHYRLPSMPWGVDRDEVEATVRRWRPNVAAVRFLDYRSPRGLPRLIGDMMGRLAVARNGVPTLVHVTVTPPQGESPRRSHATPHPLHPEATAENPPSTIGPDAPHKLTYGGFSMRSSRSHPSDRTVDAGSLDAGSLDAGSPDAGSIGGVSALAIENLSCGDDIARASRRVITKRVALGIQAALLPHRADHVEFARMAPEKVEAFSAAGQVILQKSREANRQILDEVSLEVMTAASAVVSMTRCSNPIDLARAQGRFASGLMDRAASRFVAMGMFAMTAQAAALAPMRRTVVDNCERLTG